MHTDWIGEIADDVSAARSALSDALHMAQVALMDGTDLDGWHPDRASVAGQSRLVPMYI